MKSDTLVYENDILLTNFSNDSPISTRSRSTIKEKNYYLQPQIPKFQNPDGQSSPLGRLFQVEYALQSANP